MMLLPPTPLPSPRPPPARPARHGVDVAPGHGVRVGPGLRGCVVGGLASEQVRALEAFSLKLMSSLLA